MARVPNIVIGDKLICPEALRMMEGIQDNIIMLDQAGLASALPSITPWLLAVSAVMSATLGKE
jgi:hypothetical protein